jgi:hypothetical protein
VIPVVSSGLQFRLYVDFFGFRSGPAGIELAATRIGQPFPSGDEARLYSLLVARANAHPV